MIQPFITWGGIRLQSMTPTIFGEPNLFLQERQIATSHSSISESYIRHQASQNLALETCRNPAKPMVESDIRHVWGGEEEERSIFPAPPGSPLDCYDGVTEPLRHSCLPEASTGESILRAHPAASPFTSVGTAGFRAGLEEQLPAMPPGRCGRPPVARWGREALVGARGPALAAVGGGGRRRGRGVESSEGDGGMRAGLGLGRGKRHRRVRMLRIGEGVFVKKVCNYFMIFCGV